MTISKWMFPFWCFVLAAFTLGAPDVHAQPAGCQLVSYASLAMRTLADGKVTVPLGLEGQIAYFMVDTGGANSTLNSHIADRLKLERRWSSFVNVGVGSAGTRKETVEVGDFSIGLMHGKGLKFFVDTRNVPDWAGILAPNLLGNFDLDFDFAGGKLNLISNNPCPGSNVYWTKDPVAVVPLQVGRDYHIGIPVTVDGNKIFAMIDTGSGESIMSEFAAQKLLHVDPRGGQVKRSPVDVNGVNAFTYPFRSINFEGVAVSNPHILIISSKDMRIFQNDLILGMGILRQLHIYISYKERKMYLTPATAH